MIIRPETESGVQAITNVTVEAFKTVETCCSVHMTHPSDALSYQYLNPMNPAFPGKSKL